MGKKCSNCGRSVNSKWKKLCYKCHHIKKGDFKPSKLQTRYGGNKK